MIFGYLFRDLAVLFFPPLYIASLLWCLGYCSRKKYLKGDIFVIVASVILFAFCWRLSAISLMGSKRYSAILIYPMLFSVTAFCLKIGPVFRLLAQKHVIKRPWVAPASAFAGSFLAVILIISCSLKCINRDSYATFIKTLSQTCANHAQKVTGPKYFHANDTFRISYYGRIPSRNIVHFGNKDKYTGTELLQQRIQLIKNIPGHHYIFGEKRKNEPFPTAENIKLAATDGSWKILKSLYTSRKKKKQAWVGYFKSGCPNIMEWEKKLPDLPENNFSSNGDFEKKISAETAVRLAKSHQKSGIHFYKDIATREMPKSWSVRLSSTNKRAFPDVRLSNKHPLAGHYSLLVDSRKPKARAVLNSISYRRSPCYYTVFFRAEGNRTSNVKINILSRDEQMKKNKIQQIGNFLLQPGKVYRIHGEIPTGKIPKGFQRLSLQFIVEGFVSLDQFSLTPVTQSENR